MKLWQKSGTAVNAAVETFTVGNDRAHDLEMAAFDVLGSLAHIEMLESVGLLAADEHRILRGELQNIYAEIANGNFEIQDGIEDVHSQVEYLLTARLGEMGKKIHAARSRNDQVLVDLKLFFRHKIQEITENVAALFAVLIEKSDTHKDILLPGYTHLQVAMPSSFGLWFGAYAETLCDDMHLWQGIYNIVNQNPLGSAAGYGSSLPINRTKTTALLGFGTLNFNVVHAQMGRGKTEQAVSFGLAALGHTLSRFAMDICLYLNQNFDFIALPSELTTGSSIMPHKKNPDVFELIRAKANRLQSLPTEVALLTSNLPSGYHRDFQLLKDIIFPALAELQNCLEMTTFMVKNLKVKDGILNDPKYKYIFTVEEVNRLVTEGVAFRDAYKRVGESVENQTFMFDKSIEHTHEGSVGNLCNAEITAKFEDILRGFDFETVDKAIAGLLAE